MHTNRLVSTAAGTALVLAPAAVAQAQRAIVEGMSQRLTVACGTGGAHVQGTGNTVTLTGTCGDVLVEGSSNTVHIATLGSLKVGVGWGPEGPKSGFFPFYLGLAIIAASVVNLVTVFTADPRKIFADWSPLASVPSS